MRLQASRHPEGGTPTPYGAGFGLLSNLLYIHPSKSMAQLILWPSCDLKPIAALIQLSLLSSALIGVGERGKACFKTLECKPVKETPNAFGAWGVEKRPSFTAPDPAHAAEEVASTIVLKIVRRIRGSRIDPA